LSSFLSQRRENNTLYVENSVDAGIKEVYQLSTYTVEYRKRTSTINYVELVVALAQQENKGWLTTITMKTIYNDSNQTQCTTAKHCSSGKFWLSRLLLAKITSERQTLYENRVLWVQLILFL
jgi:hypothetical protein